MWAALRKPFYASTPIRGIMTTGIQIAVNDGSDRPRHRHSDGGRHVQPHCTLPVPHCATRLALAHRLCPPLSPRGSATAHPLRLIEHVLITVERVGRNHEIAGGRRKSVQTCSIQTGKRLRESAAAKLPLQRDDERVSAPAPGLCVVERDTVSQATLRTTAIVLHVEE